MQCVILAAGRGTRMEELTGAVPKPMLMVGGKTLIEHKLDLLPDDVDEVIFVVGYLGKVIRDRFGELYNGKKIFYQEQEELNGTAGALWRARSVLKDRFIVMMGDDIYAKEDIEQCVRAKEWALLVQGLPALYRAGRVELDVDGNIVNIIESSKEDEVRKKAGIACTNMYVLDTRLFDCPLIPKYAGSEEYGLPQTVAAASKQLGIRFEPVYTDTWIQVTSPKDLTAAEKTLKKGKSSATFTPSTPDI